MGTGFEGQESVYFCEDAVRSWGRQCLCRPQAPTPARGSLIHDRMQRDAACTADLARERAVAVPTPCQTLDDLLIIIDINDIIDKNYIDLFCLLK